MPTLFNPLRTR